MNKKKTVGVTGYTDNPSSVMSGFLILPDNLDRFDYITNCLKNCTISLRTEIGELHHNVPVAIGVFQWLDFPENSAKHGSTLIVIFLPKHNVPIVVGVLPDSNQIIAQTEENSLKIVKKNKQNNIGVDFNANQAKIDMLVSSGQQPSQMNFVVLNNNETSVMRFLSKGFVEITGTQEVKLQSKSKLLLCCLKKDYTNQAFFSYDINTKLWVLRGNTASEKHEKSVLGETLLKKIEKFCSITERLVDEIGRLTVPTGVGPSGVPLNIAAFQGLKNEFSQERQKFKEFLSENFKHD